MADHSKFEETEKKIAQAENVLLENGKFINSDFDENHVLHLEEHKKGGDRMGMKAHMTSHVRHIERKERQDMEERAIEASMPLG